MGFLPVFSLVIGVGLLSLYACYIVDLEWSHTKLDTLAASQHSNIVSPYSLMIIRAFLAIIIWTTTTYIVLDREGLQLTLERADGSKRTYLLKGLSRLTMFTVWSWILQGFYFTFAFLCSFAVLHRNQYPEFYRWSQAILPSLTWVCFEISFPVAYLVSAVVTFVLYPFTKRNGLPTRTFFLPMALVMHNANIFFMAFEFMINELKFSFYHFLFMLFYGLAYVVFSWVWFHYQGMFYYFFLDYHRNYAVWWHVALLVLVSLLFFIGYFLSQLQFDGYSLMANAVGIHFSIYFLSFLIFAI